ncbi:MAG: hypothetical protein RIC51_12565, partial [Erythrobacter sp.]
MTQPPFPLWTEEAQGAAFTDPAEIARRADAFERSIRRRNLIEYAAGGIVLFPAALAAGAAALIGEYAFAFALGALAAGIIVVLRNLARRAANLEQRPEEPCVEHLERQYRRQYEALRSVPTWYVGPFVPGFVLLYGTVAWKTAGALGWRAAMEGMAVPVLATLAVGIAVVALNRWAARRI